MWLGMPMAVIVGIKRFVVFGEGKKGSYAAGRFHGDQLVLITIQLKQG